MKTNPIEREVMPLKQDAIRRAEEEAVALVERTRTELAEHGGDINAAAPYPKTTGPGALQGIAFMVARLRYIRFHSLVRRDKSRPPSHRPGEPSYVEIDEEKAKRYILQCIEGAALDYDAFVAKLITKIGKVKEAKLHGNHVWGSSTLVVTTESGEVQAWRTQQIVNHSKLGKPFNQWPTRRLKRLPQFKDAA